TVFGRRHVLAAYRCSVIQSTIMAGSRPPSSVQDPARRAGRSGRTTPTRYRGTLCAQTLHTGCDRSITLGNPPNDLRGRTPARMLAPRGRLLGVSDELRSP